MWCFVGISLRWESHLSGGGEASQRSNDWCHCLTERKSKISLCIKGMLLVSRDNKTRLTECQPAKMAVPLVSQFIVVHLSLWPWRSKIDVQCFSSRMSVNIYLVLTQRYGGCSSVLFVLIDQPSDRCRPELGCHRFVAYVTLVVDNAYYVASSTIMTWFLTIEWEGVDCRSHEAHLK